MCKVEKKIIRLVWICFLLKATKVDKTVDFSRLAFIRAQRILVSHIMKITMMDTHRTPCAATLLGRYYMCLAV